MGKIHLGKIGQRDEQAPETPCSNTGSMENSEFFEGKQVVVPCGLERDPPAEKQIYFDEGGGKYFYDGESQRPVIESLQPSVQSPKKGPRRKWYLIAIVSFVVIVVVCIPLGVVLSRNRHRRNAEHDSTTISNSSSPKVSELPVNAILTPSAITSNSSGSTLEGTRLVTMDARTGGDIFLYYQWDNGGLRYISQSPGRVWQGSTDLNVPDAKLRTPLASVSSKASTIWWLFYVDNSNIIQNIYSEKDPSMWRKGTVGNKGYKIPNSTNIAFTLSRGRKYNGTLNDLDGGLSLYASATDGTIQEYIFNDQDGSWTEGFNFPGANGLADASTWSLDSKAFIYTVSSSGSLEFWYRNYSPMVSVSDNRWQLGPSSHADLTRDGSVCGQFGVAFQGSNGSIQGSNFTTFQDLDQVRWDTLYDISEQPAMDGSAVSCWYFFPAKNAKRNVMSQVFYQTTAIKITEAVRLWGPGNSTVPGTWIYNDVPI